MNDTLNGGTGIRYRRYFVRFTLVFAALAALCFSVYIFTGKTLIWEVDAWSQHYKALIYYAQYLRGIVRTLFTEGRLVIPRWDFAFGEGGDILTTLHYYVIGDPLTVFSVFVPSRYMHIFYDALMLIRMYAAGASFSCFCFYMGEKNARAVAVGSFTYAFSYWAIVNAGRHPYFLGPMIYFPLILIGVEAVMRGRRPYFLIASVGIAALSNFYFFYMLAIVTAVYVAVRLIYEVRDKKIDVKGALGAVLRIAVCSAIGFAMAFVIFLPVCMAFLGDSRAGVDYAVGVFYPLSYYAKIPGLLMGEGGGDFWICAGFSVLALPAFVLTLRSKERPVLRACLILCAVGLCLPVVGHVLNGFTYVTNRWCWAFAAAAGYAVVVFYERTTELSRREYVAVVIVESVLVILCFALDESRTVGAQCGAAVSLVTLLLLLPRNPAGVRRWGAFIMACVSIVVNALSFTAPWGYDYASEHIASSGIFERLYNNESSRIKAIAEEAGADGFFRYSGPSVAQNAGALTGLSSTQYFWSLSNPGITARNTELQMRDYWIFRYSGYDGRTALNLLSSARYYVVPQGSRAPVPYGYEQVDSPLAGRYLIYENKSALPLVYCCGAVIDADAWEAMSASEKEAAMLRGVYIPCAGTEGLRDADMAAAERELGHEVRCGEGVHYEDGRFVVTSKDAEAELYIDRADAAELYLSLGNIKFKGTPEYDLYFGADGVDPEGIYGREEWDALGFGEHMRIIRDRVFWREPTGATLELEAGFTENSVTCYGNGFQFYNGRDDFVVNLGYHSRGLEKITVRFGRAGVYTFDEMKVTARDAAEYVAAADELCANAADSISVGRDTVSGTVTAGEDSILVFNVPFSEGWRAYIDGEPVETCRADIAYIGVRIGAGSHDFALRYETPYLTAGAYVSLAGVAAFGVTVFVTEYGIRKRKKREA